MSKLLSVLIASLFAAGAAVAQGADYGKAPSNTNAYGGQQQSAYPDTAAKDKDKADKADKMKDKDKAAYGTQYPPQQQMGANKDKDKDKAAYGDPYPPQQQMGANRDKDRDKAAYGDQHMADKDKHAKYPRDQHMADKDKADKPCPPGLLKKDNGCMPPGQARKHDDDRHVMGNKARDHDRDHLARDNRDRDDHRRGDRKHRDRDRDRSGSNSGRH